MHVWKFLRSMLAFAAPGVSCLTFVAVLQFSIAVRAQVNVYTRSYNNARTGANLSETMLTPANVAPWRFGKLFTVKTDGQLFAQPLYVAGLKINGAKHNVVYVATMNNSVYALDADKGDVLWTRNYGPPIVTQQVDAAQNISWTTGVGILSTPVIDPATNIMYFVHGYETTTNGDNDYERHLEAIDILTGDRLLGSPVNIKASYQTADLVAPITFDAKRENQRTGLALANGNVYIAFASHDDAGPYHGWVLAYSASTLQQTAVYSDTTIDNHGGIWMAGQAPAVDGAGNIYIATGNGPFGETPNHLLQTGQSFIKLSPTLQLLDYFTPDNGVYSNGSDADLGAGGVMLVPNSNWLVGGGKPGILYVADTTNLGRYNSSQDQVVQEFQAIYGVGTSHIHGTPVYFNSAVGGPNLYVWGENDTLRAYHFNAPGGLLNTVPFATSSMKAPTVYLPGAMPGGFLAISANGANDGILWASTPYVESAVTKVVQGVLYAFDANTLKLLWSDKSNDTRDEVGLFAKYCPPVVANGKVYMSTFGPVGTTDGSGALVVYGLLPALTVQVGNATMVQGSPLPAFTATATGLVHGDTLGTTLTVNYSTTATSSSTPGTYPITATISGPSVGTYYISVKAGTLTVTQPAAAHPNYGQGFSSAGLDLNQGAALAGTRLRLTDGKAFETRSAFFNSKVNVEQFTTAFQFQITNPLADGFTFTVQGVSPKAVGAAGGNLGYSGITGEPAIADSVAVKFDLYSNSGEGPDSTGMYLNGASPTTPSIDLSSSGIDLHSGHIFAANLAYDGSALTVTLTDTVTGASASQKYLVDIQGTVGGPTAWVGFTAGSGSTSSIQDILSWSFVPGAD